MRCSQIRIPVETILNQHFIDINSPSFKRTKSQRRGPKSLQRFLQSSLEMLGWAGPTSMIDSLGIRLGVNEKGADCSTEGTFQEFSATRRFADF